MYISITFYRRNELVCSVVLIASLLYNLTRLSHFLTFLQACIFKRAMVHIIADRKYIYIMTGTNFANGNKYGNHSFAITLHRSNWFVISWLWRSPWSRIMMWTCQRTQVMRPYREVCLAALNAFCTWDRRLWINQKPCHIFYYNKKPPPNFSLNALVRTGLFAFLKMQKSSNLKCYQYRHQYTRLGTSKRQFSGAHKYYCVSFQTMLFMSEKYNKCILNKIKSISCP